MDPLHEAYDYRTRTDHFPIYYYSYISQVYLCMLTLEEAVVLQVALVAVARVAGVMEGMDLEIEAKIEGSC